MNYFELINKLKDDFEYNNGVEPTHLIIGINEYLQKLEPEMIDRLIYIKDLNTGEEGEIILGLKIIKTRSIMRGMKLISKAK